MKSKTEIDNDLKILAGIKLRERMQKSIVERTSHIYSSISILAKAMAKLERNPSAGYTKAIGVKKMM